MTWWCPCSSGETLWPWQRKKISDGLWALIERGDAFRANLIIQIEPCYEDEWNNVLDALAAYPDEFETFSEAQLGGTVFTVDKATANVALSLAKVRQVILVRLP